MGGIKKGADAKMKDILDKDLGIVSFYLVAFRKISRAYQDFQLKALDGYDLSPNEIVVLSSLDTVSTASQIAADYDVSKALLSRSVKLLKAKGYIVASISEQDKREQDLTLTQEGRAVADVIAEANRHFFEKVVQGVDSDSLEVVRMMLKVLMANLSIGG